MDRKERHSKEERMDKDLKWESFDESVELAYGEWKEKVIAAALNEMTFAGVKFRAEHSYTIHYEDEESEKIGEPILNKANTIISKAAKDGNFPFLTAYKSP